MNVDAGILAIGDEVVQGQITNGNASWLASELSKINVTTTHHLACLDQKEDICNALDFLSQHCQLILVSGGLGPTVDDCTRESLSRWLGKDLIFDTQQWSHIESLLKERNLIIREGHRNQARFPEGAQVLKNSKGVAPGFFIKSKETFIASLPGPPSELQPMFLEELVPQIREQLKPESHQKLYKWVCLGAPESDIAHIAESILGSNEKLSLGYRLHKPYVEVKVWGPKVLTSAEEKLFSLFEEKIKEWFVSYSIESIRRDFHQNIARFDGVYVVDHLTSGVFLDKLKEVEKSDHIRYQCFEHKAYKHFTKEEVQQIYQHMGGNDNQLFIFIFPHTETSAHLFFNSQYKLIETPRKIPIRSLIGQLYIIENIFLIGNATLGHL